MDTLTCRSPSRCATCAHFDAGVCALEEALNEVLENPRAPPAATRPLFVMLDARRPATALT